MKFSELFSSEGNYKRYQYNITEITINLLIIVLIILVVVSRWFLLLAIPGYFLLWFIHMQATVKRLHDLGREEGDIFKLLIPVFGSFLHFGLHYQSGQDESDIEAYGEYQKQQYDKHYSSGRPKDDLGRPL